jgi:hypothetical protein
LLLLGRRVRKWGDWLGNTVTFVSHHRDLFSFSNTVVSISVVGRFDRHSTITVVDSITCTGRFDRIIQGFLGRFDHFGLFTGRFDQINSVASIE